MLILGRSGEEWVIFLVALAIGLILQVLTGGRGYQKRRKRRDVSDKGSKPDL